MNSWLTSDEVYSVNQRQYVNLWDLTPLDVIELGITALSGCLYVPANMVL